MILLCKFCSRAQDRNHQNYQKIKLRSIAICSIFFIGMVNFRCYLVNPHVHVWLLVLSKTQGLVFFTWMEFKLMKTTQCTMRLSPLKSCIKEFWLHVSLSPHFPSFWHSIFDQFHFHHKFGDEMTVSSDKTGKGTCRPTFGSCCVLFWGTSWMVIRERSFKYLDAEQVIQQISIFFKSKFHNEGGVF